MSETTFGQKDILLTYLGILENLGRWRSQDEGNTISLLWRSADKGTEAIRSFRGGRHLGRRFEIDITSWLA